MKTKQVKRLLRKAAIANDFVIDEITGNKKEVDLFGKNPRGGDVLISAKRNKSGKVIEVSYFNSGSDPFSIYDNLYISVDVDNAKKFVSEIGDTFSDTLISSKNIDAVASFIDTFNGVSPGNYSTSISINGGLDYSFA